jgi:hypothetical protein
MRSKNARTITEKKLMQRLVPEPLLDRMYNRLAGLPKRISRDYNYRRKRYGSLRKDCGQPRKSESLKPLIESIFEIKMELSDLSRGRMISTERAVEMAKRKGILNQEISVRYVNRLIDQFGLAKAKGVVRFQAEYSNQVHQFDASKEPYLQVVEDLGDGDFLLSRRAPTERYKKVQRVEGWGLWVMGCVDDFSGYAILQYVVARGESAAMAIEFMDKVWKGEIDQRIALKGIPEMIYTDNGSAFTSGMTTAYLSYLGVTAKQHLPYASRATGKMERRFGHLKKDFSLCFLSGRNEWRLSEINPMLAHWSIEQAQRSHRVLSMNREAAFIQNLQKAASLPSQDSLRSAHVFDVRKVQSDCTIRLNNEIYRVPEALRGEKVLIFRNHQGEVSVYHNDSYLQVQAESYEGMRPYGEFESYHDTQAEKTEKKRIRGEWGEHEHPYEIKDKGERIKDKESTIIPFVPIQRELSKATPFSEGEVFSDRIDAMRWIVKRLGIGLKQLADEAPLLKQKLDALLTSTLKREDVEECVQDIERELKRTAFGGGR